MSQAPPAAPPGSWQASDGNWYPPQGSQQPPPAKKRGHGCLYAMLGAAGLVVVLIIIIAVVAVSATKKVSKTASSGNLGGPPPAASYKVGDTAKTSNYQVTVYGAKNPQPPANSLFPPQAGSHFVSVDVQVTNTLKDQQAFSSLLAFHLLDSVNHQFDESVTAGLTPGAPDGQIAGGQSIRGLVVFEVPDGTTGLKLRVQGSITAGGAVFALS
jgi:hypothetical protein